MQVCSTSKSESESVIDNVSSTEENKSESVHKSINTNEVKYAIEGTDNEEPLVVDNPVINEPGYFNPLKCGRNMLNRLDSTCKRACVETSRERYYKEMYKTLTDYNDCKNVPL